jgi:hypothetical protein
MKRRNTQNARRWSEGKSPWQREGGFSLVELMMGSSVLTLILAGCFLGFGQAMVISENMKSSNFAAQVLEAEMEKLREKTWAEIGEIRESTSFNPARHFDKVVLRDYACNRSITDRSENLKQILLTVEWTDLKGMAHTRKMVTYYARNGMNDYFYRAI